MSTRWNPPRADELVLRDGLRPRGARDRLRRSRRIAAHGEDRDRSVEQPVADQLAVGDALAAARHDALADGEGCRRDAELRRRELEERLLGGGSRCTRLLAAGLDALAADTRTLVRGDVRVMRDHLHLPEVEVELLRRDHQQRRRSALAHLDLPQLQAGGVVGMDDQPRVDLRLVVGAARREWVLAGRLRGLRADPGADDAEADEHGAAALEEGLARELAFVGEAGHELPPLAIAAAACLIAVRIRG
jgi:hypothetical protein